MNVNDISEFEKLVAQLDSLHAELAMLGKKSPNDAVNAFKIKFINSALKTANGLFGEKYRPFPDFECFEPDELPSNSDVTLILSQYIECAEKLRADNIYAHLGSWYWNSKAGEERVRTGPPKKLNQR